MRVAVPRVPFAELRDGGSRESSSAVRARVVEARERMRARFRGSRRRCNAEMTKREVERYCAVDAATENVLMGAVTSRRMSARGVHRVLRVGRTLADLAAAERIAREHISLALLLRGQW